MLIPFFVSGQVQEHISKYKTWERFDVISRFYQSNGYHLVWITDVVGQTEIRRIIQMADSFGLDEEDYQYNFIRAYQDRYFLKTSADSVDADVHFTDAAIHFFSDLKFGNERPVFSYDGLKYDPSAKHTIPEDLLFHLKNRTLEKWVDQLQLGTKEYFSVLSKLSRFRRMVNDSSFRDAKVKSKNVDETNRPLLLRLYQLGITDTIMGVADRKTIADKVSKAQNLFDLLNDGELRNTTLHAFNIPLKQRIKELKTTLNYLRWLEQIKQVSDVLILNIPSATLFVYTEDTVVLDSKVIVGKPSTPTPSLTSTITDVILYPYWNVPYKIATKELLPSIKRDINFLERNNYQVLNSEGIVLNPYKIRWSSLSNRYFPYHIRQSTGCDNALGVVKFDFYNPFSVYLHDTPNKGLFSFSKRYFSHGCMRVEKPVELAHFLLGKNSIAIDTLTAKGCLYQQAPRIVTAEKNLPVIILYSTVWYDRNGETRFYDDIYGKLN